MVISRTSHTHALTNIALGLLTCPGRRGTHGADVLLAVFTLQPHLWPPTPHTHTHGPHTDFVTQRKWSYKRLNGIKERVMEEGNKEAEERPGDESPARGPVMEFSRNTVGQRPPSPEELTKPFCSL